MRRFLLISPYFPPSNVIGVKRALNLVRHLPAHGWEPIVLAAQAAGSERADDLEALVPASTVVSRSYRGALFERLAERKRSVSGPPHGSGTNNRAVRTKYLTPFDRYVWFTPAAVAEGLRLIRRHGVEAIAVNADPWSGLLVGDLLHRWTRLPWIADLRDPWSLHAAKMILRPPASRIVVRRSEERFIRSAAKVILNAESACQAYRDAYGDRVQRERFTCIRNAFDERLFEAGTEPAEPGFTLVYFGSFKPFVGSEPILEGFARFISERQLSPSEARLRVVGGPVFPEQLDRYDLRAHVELRPRIPLTRALRVLRAASALILVVEPTTPLVIPGKLYDYLAARRPILAISDNHEVNGILADTRLGLAVPYDDPAEVARGLQRIFDGCLPLQPDEVALRRYSVEAQAERFAGVLDEVTRASRLRIES